MSQLPSPETLTRHHAPNSDALAHEVHMSVADVLAVIDARGGRAYVASVETGLANRFPFLDMSARQRAIGVGVTDVLRLR